MAREVNAVVDPVSLSTFPFLSYLSQEFGGRHAQADRFPGFQLGEETLEFVPNCVGNVPYLQIRHGMLLVCREHAAKGRASEPSHAVGPPRTAAHAAA